MRFVSSILLLALLSGCAAKNRAGADAAGGNVVRLCIENATSGYGSIIAHIAMMRVEVYPGATVCRSVTQKSAVSLRAVSVGGGMQGTLNFTETLNPGLAGCWRWRLSNSRGSSALTQLPCEQMGA